MHVQCASASQSDWLAFKTETVMVRILNPSPRWRFAVTWCQQHLNDDGRNPLLAMQIDQVLR